ncbi:hypothetical protein [Pontibacter sp. G13]|uniref:hypothetical protein n=1 Tax=Pontibacter sp. G13 TaxID=3074898 RepID=UPI0028896712|nr:hypothetical protein [Pontibacter sp. G13]WNJ18137.1 hypothetical protein RJD25_25070 [Pontibacter sp. G13]
MKRLLTRLMGFACVILILVGGIWAFNSWSSSRPIQIPDKILVLGDSHMMTGVDPHRIPHAANIAQTGETYFASFYKLKALLKSDSPIDTVLLGCAWHNLSTFNDRKFVEPHWSGELFQRIYPLVGLQELRQLPDFDSESYWQTWFKQMCLIPKWTHRSFMGKYAGRSDRLCDKQLDVTIAAGRHFGMNGRTEQISATSLAYLDSIVELCREEGVFLALVNAKVHPAYQALVPVPMKDRFRKLAKDMKSRRVPMLDYQTLKLDDTQFKDYDHLNRLGAQIQTDALLRDLRGMDRTTFAENQ